MIARMKAWILLGWLMASSGAWAAEADLAGLWKNTTVGISQSTIIVSQEGAFLHVAGYGVWAGGGTGVWHGKGKIEGARVKLPLTYTLLPKPGFDPKVELDLQISNDAKSLEGTWKNNLGRKGPVKFVKVPAEAAPKVSSSAEVPAGEGPEGDGEKKETSTP
jgi:hypothetical protein